SYPRPVPYAFGRATELHYGAAVGLPSDSRMRGARRPADNALWRSAATGQFCRTAAGYAQAPVVPARADGSDYCLGHGDRGLHLEVRKAQPVGLLHELAKSGNGLADLP